MVMSIARPIKAGRNGPKTAVNQRRISQPRPNNKRPSQPKPNKAQGRSSSNSTTATRLGSAVTSGPEVITGLGDTAEVGAVAVDTEAAAEVAAVSSALK